MVEIKATIETVLVNKLAEIIPELNMVSECCAQLEVFILFAKLSIRYNLTRPKVEHV